jgi:hypothetical protein
VVPHRRTVGVLDIPRVFYSPRTLFGRVENVNHYGGTLLVLLTLVTLVGYATIETGLIDRAVERRVQERQAQLEKQFDNVVARSEFLKQLEETRKLGEFERMITRIGAVAARPAVQLAWTLLIAALLYGAVALTGRKPEWHTLMTIVVFAGFVDLLAEVVRLSLMLQHGSMEVQTSSALLLRLLPDGHSLGSGRSGAIAQSLFAGIDPFRVWFWLVVISGLTVTTQLKSWRAWLTCGLFGLVAAGVHAGVSLASAMKAPPAV